MKQTRTRKGFTLVELVIVIAVIAVLSAILIPTFGSIIENAMKAQAFDACKQMYNDYREDMLKQNIKVRSGIVLEKGEYAYVGMNGELKELTKLGESNVEFDDICLLSGVIAYDGFGEIPAVYVMPTSEAVRVYSLQISETEQYIFYVSDKAYDSKSANGVVGCLEAEENGIKRYLSAYGRYSNTFNPITTYGKDISPMLYYMDTEVFTIINNIETVTVNNTSGITEYSFGFFYDDYILDPADKVVVGASSVTIAAADFASFSTKGTEYVNQKYQRIVTFIIEQL